jgi:hypothetical protein
MSEHSVPRGHGICLFCQMCPHTGSNSTCDLLLALEPPRWWQLAVLPRAFDLCGGGPGAPNRQLSRQG